MQNCIKKSLVLAAEVSVLSLEISGIHQVNLKPSVGGLLVRIGKEAYGLVVGACKH